jgi:hypothetical protein
MTATAAEMRQNSRILYLSGMPLPRIAAARPNRLDAGKA